MITDSNWFPELPGADVWWGELTVPQDGDVSVEVASWWRHQMEIFSALLAIWAGNSPATGEFPARRPVTRSFGVFFDLRLNKRLSKHSWGWWFEKPSRPLRRHCNDTTRLTHHSSQYNNGQIHLRCCIDGKGVRPKIRIRGIFFSYMQSLS